MKLVQLNYASIGELLHDINDAALTNELVGVVNDGSDVFCALVRVSDQWAKTLAKCPAAIAAAARNNEREQRVKS